MPHSAPRKAPTATSAAGPRDDPGPETVPGLEHRHVGEEGADGRPAPGPRVARGDADGQRPADGHRAEEPDERRRHRPIELERPGPPRPERGAVAAARAGATVDRRRTTAAPYPLRHRPIVSVGPEPDVDAQVSVFSPQKQAKGLSLYGAIST